MIDILKREKIVAIVRGIPASAARPTAEALADGGIRLIEVTMDTEDAASIIADWKSRYSDRMGVGAGTVIDLPTAQAALDAGAEFLISPNLDEEVVEFGVKNGVEVWPGVTTSTEVVRAWKAGASAVKLFPAGALGPRYFKELHAPLRQIPKIAVGGVNRENLAEFLKAGAIAVGVGGSLVDLDLIRAGKFEELAARAREFVALAHAEQAGTEK